MLDYDAMDHAEVNARFVADFLEAHGACRGGLILDVGTGTGSFRSNRVVVTQRQGSSRLTWPSRCSRWGR